MKAVDLFAGGGGASLGIQRALGVSPVAAVNHCLHAIQMHEANHPDTLHFCEDVFTVKPRQAVARGSIDLLWASPDCTHFSRARGGKPREKKIRMLAWVVVEWASAIRPRVICLENVAEFTTWGPLDEDGHPIPERAGETFQEFIGRLTLLGYRVEWRVLNAADYGAPTSRRRLFLVARCDGEEIRWPTPTHGPGRLHPWRTAAECIDWSIPCPSIFDRERELAEATQRRIAEGVRRFVLEASRPFLLNLSHGGRLEPLERPLNTVTAGPRGGDRALVVPSLVQTGYGERQGQAPRVLDIQAPLGTVVGGGAKHALVAAFLAKHYGGVVGHGVDRPLGAVTAIDHHAVVAAHLVANTTGNPPMPLTAPLKTVTTGGHHAVVAAFLAKYYGQGGQWSRLDEPMGTATSKARMGLVTVQLDGEPWVLADIGMRMLQPRELARAQGFPDSYILTGSKSDQIARIGNSVCPPVAEALVRAQFGRELHQVAAK